MKKPGFGNFLQQKRKEAGLSQRDVSDKLGYSTPQFISNWERGVSNPPVNALKKLGAIYKTSPEKMFEEFLENEKAQLERDLKRKFNSGRAA